MGKRTSPKGDATSRARSTKADGAPASLNEGEIDILSALSSQYDEYPTLPVRRVIDATRDLAKSAHKLSSELIEGSDLDSDSIAELERRVDVLERAELEWRAARKVRANPELVAARAEGEVHRRDTNATLRYFLRHDAEVQQQLDEIAEGTGDSDLVDDLRKHSDIVARHRLALARAKKSLGERPVERGRALAKRIETAAADMKYDARAAETLSLRNRAYWHSRELEGEVREAGRFVFRNDAKKLDAFLREPYGVAGPEEASEDPNGGGGGGDGGSTDAEKLSPAPDEASKKPVEPAKKPEATPAPPKKKSK